MASKVKATVALDKEIFALVDREAQRRRQTRSAIVEEALQVWRNRGLEAALKEGYQAMAAEDQKTAEEHLPLSREVPS